MPVTIGLIVIGMFALAAFELWLFWTLGERDDRRRRYRRGDATNRTAANDSSGRQHNL